MERICDYCGCKFDGRTRNKFCSVICFASYRRHNHSCASCGKPILGREARKRSFCSGKCASNYKYNQYIQRWKRGEETGLRGEAISNHIRRYMFEKYSSKCRICGWNVINRTTGKIPLTINHINGNWRDCRENNVELLCPNCHSLTPNYGSLNKGHGRVIRLTRLKGGVI